MREEYRRFEEDRKEYEEISRSLDAKEIDLRDYKGVSCGVGSYPQREGKHMLRLRLPGGRMTREQLRVILDLSKEFGVRLMKFTTGQSMQLHDLTTETVRQLIPRLWEAGILTKGAGGNYPVNMMASPLSGVEIGEYFDVLPAAEEISDYLVEQMDRIILPRKFKVGFSNSPKNETHATCKDLGFAAKEDGTFDVYIAGGLGIHPLLGIRVGEHVPQEELLYYTDAMLRLYSAKGNYKNRNKARTRYLQETLGVDVLKEQYGEYLRESFNREELRHRAEKNREIAVPVERREAEETKPLMTDRTSEDSLGPAEKMHDNFRIRPQKQEGLYTVFCHPTGGYITEKQLERLYEDTEKMPKIEFRLSPDSGVYIINCTAKEADSLCQTTESYCAKDTFETSVACVGRSRCAIGVCNSQGLLESCLEAVKEEHFAPGVLPKLHISGCISSCSAQQMADLGFRGIMKRTEDGLTAAFFVTWGGSELENEEVIAESKDVMLADEIPHFLIDLGRKIQKEQMTYRQWIRTYPEKMDRLIEKYKYTA